MQKLSGLILDIYDDRDGDVMRAMFSNTEDIPDMIKSAHALTPEEHGKLKDDVFALVLVDGDVTLRKFACIDTGNTALNIEYFLVNRHKLPEEAQKVAAANLVKACGWYDISPPEDLVEVANV